MHKAALFIGALAICTLVACGNDAPGMSDNAPAKAQPSKTAEKKTTQPSMPGLHVVGNQLMLQTDEFTVPPSTETYMCWTATVSYAIKVQSYETGGHSVIHHFVLATTTGGEADGIAECDAAFQLTWRPLFAAGLARRR